MARPDFTKKWASSRPSIPEIASPDYAQGFANYLGAIPPSTDDHDYIMNLQDERAVWLDENKAPLASPAFTGTPTAPTAAPGTSNTQVATTAFVALAGNLLNTTRIDVASAATVNLTSSAPNTRHINITGTTSITAFTVAAGQTYFVRFAGALTLTNNASIVTQSGVNIITAAGDTCIVRATAENVVEVMVYVDATVQSLAANGYRKIKGGLIFQWGTIANASRAIDGVTLPVTFPVSFPAGIINAGATIRAGNAVAVTSIDGFATVRNITNSSMDVIACSTVTATIDYGAYWFAIGY